MKPLLLNVATRPFLNNRLVGTALGIAAAALLLATVWNLSVYLGYGGSYRQLSLDERQDRERLAILFNEERSLTKEVQARDFRGAYERGRLAGDLISRWSFSWTLLFNRLEQVMPVDVMMTAIRPTFGPQGVVVRVEGVAKSQPALIIFEEALLRQPAFRRIYPLSERRLNPSRPEISFVLNFDYVPGEVAPPAVTTAALDAGKEAATAATPAPIAAPAGTPAPPTAPAAIPVSTPPTAVPVSTPPPAPAIVATAGSVARDGQVRTPESLARLILAPGGVYRPPEAQRLQEAEARKDRKGRKGAKPAAPGTTTTGSPPASASQGTAGAPASSASAPAGSAPAPAGSTPAPAGTGSTAVVPPRVAMPKGEGVPRGPMDRAATRAAAERPRPAVPATRLDVPLVFEARPVGDVYDALARAHHIRFDVDGGVDRSARVTLNLQGTMLADAIRMVARAAGHRVVRQGEGVYRVALATGGEPMGDRPVREEQLAAPDGGAAGPGGER